MGRKPTTLFDVRGRFALGVLVVTLFGVVDFLSAQAAKQLFVTVSAGGYHTCALSGSGTAYCWGLNLWGQLGSGVIDPTADALPPFGPGAYGEAGQASVSTPTRVATDLVFSSVSAGDRHACALTREEKAYCWGDNRFGQLGDGTTETRSRPTAVAGELTFSVISAGGTHTCGVDREGALYCWGGNWHGQAGVGREAAYLPSVTSPVKVASGLRFADVAAGGIHTCGLDVDGRAHCWGDRRGGVLGTGREEPVDVFTPRPVAGASRYRSVSAGQSLTCAVDLEDRLYCWGAGPTASADGIALGPREMNSPLSGGIRKVSVGPGYVCMVSEHRTLVGLGAATDVGCTAVPMDPNQPVLEVTAGGNAFGQHACAVLDGGRVRCWGDDSRGQLGGQRPRG